MISTLKPIIEASINKYHPYEVQTISSHSLYNSIFLPTSKKGNASTPIKEVDICIYGGTSAGVIAAYSAKKWANPFFW